KRQTGDQDGREGEGERAEDRERVEEHGASMETGLDRLVDEEIERAEQEHAADGERRPPWPAGTVHFERDQEAAEVRDLGAREAQQVGWAPEGHVEPEETMPEVVDRRGQDDDRHAPPGQVKA